MGAIEFNDSAYKTALAGNLGAYYRFESNGNDTSANANNATAVNSPVYAAGVFGNGVDLELSSTQYLTAPNHSSLNATTSISISAWIKPESLPGNGTIACKGRANGDANTRYNFRVTSAGKLDFSYASSGPTFHEWLSTNVLITTGAWYHVVLVYTYGTAASLKVYVNGQVYGGSWIGGTGNSAVLTESDVLHIGAIHSVSGADELFDGIIDDLVILPDYILLPDQVKELYEGRTLGELWPNYSDNLQGLWHLSGTTDSSSNAYNLTNNNTVTFPSGKFNNCANFVAASSQSLTVTATNANVGTSQTWLMWYKGGTTGGDSFPMGFRTNGGSDYKGIQIQDGAEQRVAFYGGTTLTPNNINAPNNSLVKDRWVCVIGVYDSTAGTIKLFIDGILQAFSTTTGSFQTSTASFGLGRWGAHVVGYYNGQLDECGIWTRAWSDAEVKNYYAWAKGVRTSTP